MKRSFNNISDFPYNTNDGGAWLRKALDPAELAVEVVGMPDTNTNPRTVLNYQAQYDIPPPETDSYNPTTVAGYDANLYLYQDPIIFGMSVSYPQGTTNPLANSITFDFGRRQFTLPVGTAPRTVNVFMNDQIEGSTYAEKRQNFSKYCQRYRMIYGGVQGIPACSDMFDSGTIEATQQIFNPENSVTGNLVTYRGPTPFTVSVLNHTLPDPVGPTVVPTAKVLKKQTYRPNDFPDSGSAIQNPSALYCRYKEGVYMPYKIKNPVLHPYLNSEDSTVVDAPYIMTGLAAFQMMTSPVEAVWMDYDPATRTFSAPYDGASSSYMQTSGARFWIKCYTKTGIPFWFVVDSTSVNASLPNPNVHTFTFPDVVNSYQTRDYLTENIVYDNESDPSARITYYRLYTTNAILGPNSEDLFTSEFFKVLPMHETNIGVINFKSIAVQASIRLIFRLGFELMIVAGGVYSPFKHKPPKYDQKAIDSYVSATHNMRDAFYGDAATSAGHQEFSSRILDIVSGNTGTGWYGQVGV